MASQGVSTVVQVTSTAILARLLTPADYGIIAMVAAITSFAGLFQDFGLSSATIQKKYLTSEQQSNLFWLNVTTGAALTLVVAACSPLVSWFYGRPELTAVTVALSFNFLINSFGTQHGAILVRNMLFGRKAMAGITGGVLSLIVAVVLACYGFSYWAIVVSSLAGSLVVSALLFVLSPFWPGPWTRGAGIRDMIGFGVNITAFDFVNYFHRNLDNILIGRYWGTEQLGLYSRSYALLMLPIHAIRGPITTVAFPAMSQLRGVPHEFRAYYRRMISLVALCTMPLTAFLFVASRPLIEVVLGSQWIPASEIFSALALASFLMPISGTRGIVFLSTGKGREYLVLGAFGAVVTSIGFIAGLPWGPVGVAVGYSVAIYAIQPPAIWYTTRKTVMTVRDMVAPTLVSAGVSVLSAAISYFALAPFRLGPVSELMWYSFIFFATYAMATIALLWLGRRSNSCYFDSYGFVYRVLLKNWKTCLS